MVGTLSTDGHRVALQRLRHIARAAGKRTYTFLVGRPTVTKLGNFPEVDVFVMVADQGGQILDCKEFLAPIVTPYEAQLAWTDDAGDVLRGLPLGFDHLVDRAGDDVDDDGSTNWETTSNNAVHSLVARGDGGLVARALCVRNGDCSYITTRTGGAGALVEANSATEYFLHQRTFKGLETPASGAARKEGAAAVPGRTGRAAGYTHENH